MKKSLVLSCLAALLTFGATSASAQNIKIGTVDMKRVFESYYKTKDAESKINEKRNSAKKELEDRMEVAKKALEDIKKLDDDLTKPELSSSAKAEKMSIKQNKVNDFNNMDREIREFQQTQEKQLNELSVRMRAGIVEEISKVVDAKVKSDNYDLVLDKSGPSLNGVPIVLFSRETWDFTPDVVTALNKTKGTATVPTPPAVAPTPSSKPKKGN